MSSTSDAGTVPAPGVLVLDYADESPDYPATSCAVKGKAKGRLGKGHSIWAITAELAEGTELQWSAVHGDEVVYVFDGALEVDGKSCGSRGSVIIEANVETRVRALAPTQIIHFGPADPAPPVDGPLGEASQLGHSVRVIAEKESDTIRFTDSKGTIYDSRFYADGTSPTCRLAFFGVNSSGASYAPPHRHTQDEIIHVVSGELHLGTLVIGAGMSVAIRADARYSFTAPGPLEFLNYRRDVSYVLMRDKPPEIETAAGAREMAKGDMLRGID